MKFLCLFYTLDMMKYRVPIERQVTVERLCGAFSGAIDPNVCHWCPVVSL